jgi:cytochrome d ubiquinol oxidase subunit I
MFQIGNEADRESIINIKIPSLLSFLTYDTPDGLVHGINPLQAQYEAQYGPGNYVPPAIWLTYWSFRLMVGSGMLLFALGVVGLLLTWRHYFNPGKGRWFLRALVPAILLPYVANTTGWLLTEVGRQPWVVQGLMTVEDAVSPNVSVEMVLISLVGFTTIYGILMIADIYLIQKYARQDDDRIIPWQDKDQPDAPTTLEGAY